MSKTWKTQKQIKIIIFHFETFWAIFELVWSRAKRTGKSNYPWGPFLQVFFRGWNSSPPLLLHTLKLGQKQEEEQSFEYVGQENSTNRSTHSLLRTNTYDEVKYIAKYIFFVVFWKAMWSKSSISCRFRPGTELISGKPQGSVSVISGLRVESRGRKCDDSRGSSSRSIIQETFSLPFSLLLQNKDVIPIIKVEFRVFGQPTQFSLVLDTLLLSLSL